MTTTAKLSALLFAQFLSFLITGTNVAKAEGASTKIPYKFSVNPNAPTKPVDNRPAMVFSHEGALNESPQQAEEKTNPVDNIANDTPFVTYIGYPKYFLQLTLTPTPTSFKQEYNNLPLNYSSSNLTSFDLLSRITITPQVFAELEVANSSVAVKSKNLTLYQINESSVDLSTVNFRMNYCILGKVSFHQFCPGVDLGFDQYPTLDFANSTSIEITKIKDTTAGAYLFYQYPALPNLFWQTRVAYLTGLLVGQDENLKVTMNNRTVFRTGFMWSASENYHIFGLLSYEERNAAVTQVIGSNTDNWKVKSNALGAHVGIQFNFPRE